jgi:outer membrane protein TolC
VPRGIREYLRTLRPRLIVPIALALPGCAVGPNFKPPSPPAPNAYGADGVLIQTEATSVSGGEAQRFQWGHDLPGQWWTLFGSNRLNALIADAMQNYPDIAAQQAALRAARETVRAEEGVFLPQMQGSGGASRERSSGAAIAPGFPGFITNIYQATIVYLRRFRRRASHGRRPAGAG